jgi:hypothetical protein
MEINTAGALSQYAYQSALQNAQAAGATPAGAQGAAVYQALTSAFSADGNSSSGDPLVDAAGASGLASLVSGIYSAAAAGGGTPIASLSSALATAVGGTDATTASGLLSGLGTDGLDGISADALSLNSTLALAAYTDTQNGLAPGTLTSLAQTAAASIDPTQPSSVQAAIQASLSGSSATTLNLLA